MICIHIHNILRVAVWCAQYCARKLGSVSVSHFRPDPGGGPGRPMRGIIAWMFVFWLPASAVPAGAGEGWRGAERREERGAERK